MVPQELRPLFWDVDADKFDPEAHPEYTILRVLEWGDRPSLAWLGETFSEAQIKEVIRSERRLSPRSANFWALVYRIPPEEVASLQQGG
ncbi:MAG: hypothetical protein AAB225_21610 [Acidobacteriota bacterium]